MLDRFLYVILSTLEALARVLAPKIALSDKVQVQRDLSIRAWDQTEVFVDLYTPQNQKEPELGWPLVLLIHGGGFRFFSKDSHAVVAAKLCQMGFSVISTNYRLAPKYPYPFGLMDTVSVYDWIQTQKDFKFDLNKLSLVGESAGANFVLNLCLISSKWINLNDKIKADLNIFGITTERLSSIEKNWKAPKKAILHCGYFETSNVEMKPEFSNLSFVVKHRMKMIEKNYYPVKGSLSDPYLVVESLKNQNQFSKLFPDIFIPVGESDPVLRDSERLFKSLNNLRTNFKLDFHLSFKNYPKSTHAFYTMAWAKQYRQVWSDIESFLRF